MIEKRLRLGGCGVWRERRLEGIVEEIALGSDRRENLSQVVPVHWPRCLPLCASLWGRGGGLCGWRREFSPWAQGLGCRLPGAWVLSLVAPSPPLHPPGFPLLGVWGGQGLMVCAEL